MKLLDYLALRNLTPTRFAEDVGIPASTITRIIKGERSPGLDVMAKIAKATADAVMPNDFLPPVPRGGSDNGSAA
jgi:predicted transcriptional regulator